MIFAADRAVESGRKVKQCQHHEVARIQSQEYTASTFKTAVSVERYDLYADWESGSRL